MAISAMNLFLVFSMAFNVFLLVKQLQLQLPSDGGQRQPMATAGASNFCSNDLHDHGEEVCAAMGGEAARRVQLEGMETATSAKDDGKIPIVLGHGDPTMYEEYWRLAGEKARVTIAGEQGMSYNSDETNLCWFLEPQFAKAVIRLHKLVGNAITENRHIVVGTGSSQLFQAALYALTPSGLSEPIDVVSQAPYYSAYPQMTNFLKSGLYEWAGDANKYEKDRPYIELVTSPNNPDGSLRQAVVNTSSGGLGMLIHDFAYYWPHYTPITSPADHALMLFTVSKCTGHAGSRVGWALVKDERIAKKMTEFIEISSIGVSRESQIRAAKIMDVVSDSHEGRFGINPFFDYAYQLAARRWEQLREAVNKCKLFTLPADHLPSAATCSFTGRTFNTISAFAWLRCEGEIENCGAFLEELNIFGRDGSMFGCSSKFVRISMLDTPQKFQILVHRLSSLC